MRLILAAATALALAAPAWAAPLATIAGNPIVRSGPGDQYSALGRIARGTSVTLTRCTPDDNGYSPFSGGLGAEAPGWCQIEGVGWVEASFVIGMAAKIDATPAQSIASPPSFLFQNR